MTSNQYYVCMYIMEEIPDNIMYELNTWFTSIIGLTVIIKLTN
jgi:hypothetical protein